MHTEAEVQQKLKDLNFDPGPIDGVFGVQTLNAYNLYRRNKGEAPVAPYQFTLASVSAELWPDEIPPPKPSVFDNLGTLLAILDLLKGKTMTSDQITGILRAVLAAVGGWLVSKGLIDSATATSLAGAAVTILTGLWSIWSNRPKTIVPIAAK